MKYLILTSIFVISVAQAQDPMGNTGLRGYQMGVNNGIGLGYGSSFGTPYSAGYGLSPEALGKFRQIDEWNKFTYESEKRKTGINAKQLQNIDSTLQQEVMNAQDKLNWVITNKKCADKLQTLADLTRPVTGSKEFIYNSDTVTISDGKKTMVYTKNGLTTVDGQCSYDSKKSTRDGLKMIFESTLPKLAPSRADMEKYPDVAKTHYNRMKAHLETLISCESALGTEYVQEIASKYLMISPSSSSAKPAKQNGAR